MEKSTPIGLISGVLLILVVVFLGDGWQTFFDIPSAILVVGGTVAALLVNFDLREVIVVPEAVKRFFAFRPPDLAAYVEEFSDAARLARREGLLALDRRLGRLLHTVSLEEAVMSTCPSSPPGTWSMRVVIHWS